MPSHLLIKYVKAVKAVSYCRNRVALPVYVSEVREIHR
jgi:hypothetical protein